MHGAKKNELKQLVVTASEARKKVHVLSGMKYQQMCHVQAVFSHRLQFIHSVLHVGSLALVHCVGQ